MIYCTERKIGIFLNPKAGSTSVMKAFENIPVTFKKHTHLDYPVALTAYNLPQFDEYRFFCFYRDPVSRFNSAFKFLKRETFLLALKNFSTEQEVLSANAQIRKKMYDDYMFMNRRYPDRYFWLSEETRTILESITVEQALTMVRALEDTPSVQRGDIGFAQQKRWFDHDIDITYLNFADYDNELRRLLSFFDVTIDEIPYENENINLDTDVPFTAEETNLIMQKYQVDYDFFATKGITF